MRRECEACSTCRRGRYDAGDGRFSCCEEHELGGISGTETATNLLERWCFRYLTYERQCIHQRIIPQPGDHVELVGQGTKRGSDHGLVANMHHHHVSPGAKSRLDEYLRQSQQLNAPLKMPVAGSE